MIEMHPIVFAIFCIILWTASGATYEFFDQDCIIPSHQVE